MPTIQQCKTVIAVGALLAAGGAFAATMNKTDYAAAKDRISAEYKSDKAACAQSSGNANDVCKLKAKGKEKVARAELEYNYSGKPSDSRKLAVAKADSTYAVAKEMCDDKAGNAKDVCRAEAKAAHTKATVDAKTNEKVGAVKKDAAEDKRDADYRVATEKCDSLAGDAKSACIASAKARFNKT